ncbi:hypothetical protein GGS20DRAFT_463523 [Poronia punctata]|nr:hypothetical protein GGS20DRAFT_463523 [Poronia punctata]
MTIFLDFDGTITTEDTVTHLANFALRFQSEERERQRHGDDDDDDDLTTTSPDLSSRWDEVVHAYVSDYKSHVSSYAPPAADRLRVEDEVTFLRSQKHVETRSLGRINECALFRGISDDVFREAGRRLVEDGTVRLRPGFGRLVRGALGRGRRVCVVSVNWSAAFIEGAACGEFAAGEVTVYANEVREVDGAVLGPRDGTGKVLLGGGRNLTNSEDKRDVVRMVMGLARDSERGAPVFCYFGDSTTDMECLLEATRGVVIADDEESGLIKTLRRLGKRVPHVRDAEADEEIVWAVDFEEVMAAPKFGLT